MGRCSLNSRGRFCVCTSFFPLLHCVVPITINIAMDINQDQQPLTKKQRKELRRQVRRDEQQHVRKASQMKKLLVWVGVVVVAGGIVWLVVAAGGPTEPVIPDTDPFKGVENAEVVVTEYSDFQCPACKAAQPVVKQVVDQYGDRIKFVYANFPIPSHQNGDEAARAGECGFDQGKFWELHDVFFDKQETWGNLADPKEEFTTYATSVGMDATAFATCYDGSDAKNRVQQDTREANSKGVNSTPTFFVNGQKIVGAQPLSKFQEAIDEELAK